MLNRIVKSVAMVGVVAFMGMVSSRAVAESVTFKTVILLNNTNPSITKSGPVSDIIPHSGFSTVGGAGDSLTATGGTFTDTVISGSPQTVSFGTFTFAGTVANFPFGTTATPTTVTIDIFQLSTSPGGVSSGSGTFVGSAVGTFSSSVSTDHFTLNITSPTSFSLPSSGLFPPDVTYSIATQTISGTGVDNIVGKLSITDAPKTPLPAAAGSGLVLLGVLGVGRRLKMSRNTKAV